MKDNVKSPNHYKLDNLGLEVIDVIEGALRNSDVDQYVGFLWGNVLKYTFRWPHKNNIEDLKKARRYIDYLIKYLDGKEGGSIEK